MCCHFRDLHSFRQQDVQSHLQAELLSNDETHPPETSFTSHRTGPANDEDAIVSKERSHRNQVRIIILYVGKTYSVSHQLLNSTFESQGFDSPALDPEMEEVRESTTMNARHSRSMSDPARPFASRSRRADLSPLRENPNTSNFLQHTPSEEDLEEREPKSPPGSQPTVYSTPHSPLNRRVTSRYQWPSDDDYVMVPSSSVALNHSRTSPLSYRPSAPARLGGTRRRGIQDDDAPESSTHDSELASHTAQRDAAYSQGSAQRSFYLPSFGSTRR